MIPQDTQTLRVIWAGLVGRVIVAFGGIELRIFECLIDLPVKSLYEEYKNKEFGKRASRAIDEINASDLKPQLRIRLVSLVNLAIRKAEDRNLIAHNPFRLGFYSDDRGCLDFRPEARSIRQEDKFITLAQLEVLANDIEQLEQDLYLAVGNASFASRKEA